MGHKLVELVHNGHFFLPIVQPFFLLCNNMDIFYEKSLKIFQILFIVDIMWTIYVAAFYTYVSLRPCDI